MHLQKRASVLPLCRGDWEPKQPLEHSAPWAGVVVGAIRRRCQRERA